MSKTCSEQGAMMHERTIPQGEYPVDIPVIEPRRRVGSLLRYTTEEQGQSGKNLPFAAKLGKIKHVLSNWRIGYLK